MTPATQPAERTVYVVKRGDTLWAIARRYGTTWQTLQQINQIDNAFHWLNQVDRGVVEKSKGNVIHDNTFANGETGIVLEAPAEYTVILANLFDWMQTAVAFMAQEQSLSPVSRFRYNGFNNMEQAFDKLPTHLDARHNYWGPGCPEGPACDNIFDKEEVTVPPAGAVGVHDRLYRIEADSATDQAIDQFENPTTVSFNHSNDDLPPGETVEDLYVFYWDEALDAWIPVPSRVDPETGAVTAAAHKPGTYALLNAGGMPLPRDREDHWSEAEVLKMAALGAVTGFGDGTYRPDDTLTRLQFTAILTRIADLEPSDTAPDFADNIPDWGAGYLAAAVAQDLISGYEDGTFRPDEPIAREQLAVMLMRILPVGVEAGELNMSDGDSVSDWAVDSVARAVAIGIINGFEDGTFRPHETATLAQAAAMASRLVDILAELL